MMTTTTLLARKSSDRLDRWCHSVKGRQCDRITLSAAPGARGIRSGTAWDRGGIATAPPVDAYDLEASNESLRGLARVELERDSHGWSVVAYEWDSQVLPCDSDYTEQIARAIEIGLCRHAVRTALGQIQRDPQHAEEWLAKIVEAQQEYASLVGHMGLDYPICATVR